jgi:sulfur-oxidizing protein SoxY
MSRPARAKTSFSPERRQSLALGARATLGSGLVALTSALGLGWANNTFAKDDPVEHMMTSGKLRSVSEMLAGVKEYDVRESQLKSEGIQLHLSILADNGNSVPLGVSVASPMTPQSHVTDIYLLSQRNPVLVMAHLQLGPWNGRAELNTRVRLAGSQKVFALARTNENLWLVDSADIIVTESACVDASN